MLAFARMVDAVGNSFLIVVLPLYIGSGLVHGDAFGLTETAVIGIVLSAFGLVNSAAQPFAGRLSDLLRRRKPLIVAGLGLLAVTNLAYLWTGTYASVLAVRALQGIGVALTIPATLALVNELSVTGTRGGNMGLYNTFRLVGFGAGPVIAGALVHHGPYTLPLAGEPVVSGFQAAFAFASLAALAGVLLVMGLVRDPEEVRASAAPDLSMRVRSEKPGQLLDPILTLGLVTLFMASAIALLSSIENVVNARLDQTPTWFGLQFAAFILPQVLFQTPVGRWSDRRGRLPFIFWGMLLLVPTTLAQGLVTGPVQMLVARLAQGGAGALVFAPALAMGGDLAREGASGSSLAVLTMGFGIGLAAGPLIAGFLVDLGFVVPFAFGAGLALVGAVLVRSQLDETVGAQAEPSPACRDASQR